MPHETHAIDPAFAWQQDLRRATAQSSGATVTDDSSTLVALSHALFELDCLP